MQDFQAHTDLHPLVKTDFEHFFRKAADCMFITDGEGTVLDFNLAFEKLTGYSRKELFERHGGWGILHPDDLEAATDHVKYILSGKTPLAGFLCRIICKDNTEKYISFDTTFDKQHNLIYAIGRDITETEYQRGQLRRSEERFRSIFQNTTFGILLIGVDKKIVEVNEKLVQRLGYQYDEFMQLRLDNIIHQDDIESCRKQLKEVLSGETTISFGEKRFIRQDGTTTWSKISCEAMMISEKEKVVMAVVEDIDAIKLHKQALFESEEKFRAVFESSSMGIMITRYPGLIIDVNPAMCTMFGYRKKELIGKKVMELTYHADVNRSKKFLEKIGKSDEKEFVIEKRYVKKDGKTFWGKAVVSKMTSINGESLGVSIIENIDKKKRTEQTLEQRNRELMQTNQELEHFAYVASHDLQEPLRTITSFIQILEKRYSDRFDKDGKQFMGFVVEGSKRMQTLIHDLLEYSRINRLNTNYEKVDLNDVFTTVNRALKDKIESNDALVMAENLPTILGSKLQLTQMFQNLIDNAIKFRGRKKPEIIISVKSVGDKWELAFKDNGIGISQEYFQRIFVIFQRLHTLEEYGGTGIGLAICKKIVERHGGEIWVESTPGKGSTFHLTLAKNQMIPVS